RRASSSTRWTTSTASSSSTARRATSARRPCASCASRPRRPRSGPVRTVYLGTSGFAGRVLERLAETPHRPVLVVTRPDRPAGRGRRLTAPPVAGVARRLGIDLAQPEDVNGPEARARIAAAEPDVVVVCAFGAILKEPLLSEFELLNVHPSLLPRWRGAAPVERAIMAGDPETGVSIMRVTAGLDSGPVALTATEPIGPEDTYGPLAPRRDAERVDAEHSRRPWAPGGARRGPAVRRGARGGGPPYAEQDEALVTYAD